MGLEIPLIWHWVIRASLAAASLTDRRLSPEKSVQLNKDGEFPFRKDSIQRCDPVLTTQRLRLPGLEFSRQKQTLEILANLFNK